MKRINRNAEPAQLENYRTTNPSSTWEQMRGDALGRTAYGVTRSRLISDQGGICAFCEIDIRDNDPYKCRVEHFHPKSDTSTPHNWALDWSNMFGVCMGGSQRHQKSPHTLEPLSENLSCDAYKDMMIRNGDLDEQCEGWIINPVGIPDSPCLFRLEKHTGCLFPDEDQCRDVTLPDNRHASTLLLVQYTIKMLNLNCSRLCEARKQVIWNIEHNKKRPRVRGVSPQQALHELAERYFRQRWPGFFTTIRLCLGPAAEQYLTDARFQG